MNIIIRRMKSSDADALYRLLSDPEVMRYLEPLYDRAQTEAFLHRAGLSEPPLVYAAEGNGRFIGYVIYHPYDEESIEIGWVLFPAYWGRGYASALTISSFAEQNRSIRASLSSAFQSRRQRIESQ